MQVFVPVVPAVPDDVFVPVALPARYVPIAFVPASSSPVTNSLATVVPGVAGILSSVVLSSVSSTDYSVVSSVNFVPTSALHLPLVLE